MRAENFDVQDIIDHLKGTCGNYISSSLGEDGILNEDYTPKYPEMTEDDLTQKDFNAIDNQIFLCDCCGWWCEISEANENPEGGSDICNDCLEEKEE